jgi:hypothetical protein
VTAEGESAAGEAMNSYDLIGRVVKAGGLYYAEVVRWTATGFEFDRKPRGYFLLRGAVSVIVNHEEELHWSS